MSILSGLLALGLQLCLPPFLVVLALVLFLASFGKSLGIRRLYVKGLLYVFEFARMITTEHTKRRRESLFKLEESSDEETEDDNVNVSATENPAVEKDYENQQPVPDIVVNDEDVSKMRHYMKNFGKESRHNVISRKDNLMLSPCKSFTLEEESTTATEKSAKDWQTKLKAGEAVSAATLQREFELDDILDYIKTGIASVIEDEVTQRFVAEELKSWNLLTRTSQSFEFVNIRLTVIWIFGFFVRYFILLPGRTVILVVGLTYLILMTSVIALIPNQNIRAWLYEYASLVCFRIISRSFSAVVSFHNKHYRAKSDGICVANHTTPIDVVILQMDMSYALVGQSHGGFLGLVQRALSRATAHIWFERSEVKDRTLVLTRLREHVEDPNKLPILIFPEGTCINNTSVMQFKKGSFEVGGVIYPVAIKYDPKFGDAFWNSAEYGMVHYLYMMMTSWAIVCDVWYLPPMYRREGEDAVDFANRVKGEIARQGGLVDLMWDGNLKRNSVKSEWKALQQEEFSKRLKVE